MGSKRPFDEQESFQLPYKYSKQFASDEKLISFVDEMAAPVACMLPGIETKANINKPPLLVEQFVVKTSAQVIRNVVDGAMVGGPRFQCGADSYREDSSWYRDFERSFLPDYCLDSGFSRRAPVNVVDALPSFLDRYPRKPVPVGVNHQAFIPESESPKPSSSHGSSFNSGQARITDEERIFMGTCVIPMPESLLSAQSSLPVGIGRKDCDCVDKASVRCVRQHVKEARDKLVKDIGEERFRNLGFLDMGEEVASKWSEEEEEVFHAIVFSNPASSGKDFWFCLLEEYPTRSMKDIVSYYFNVFMLRKRASQNRSRFLDIDSDDDEWHPSHGQSYELDFSGESNHCYSSDEDDSSSADDEEKDSSQLNMKSAHNGKEFVPVNQDGSCSSFEYQACLNDNPPSEKVAPSKEINKSKSDYKYVSSDQTEPDNGLNQGCLVDSSYFRQWDQGFSAGLDHLLPTQNMIEEIFGPGSWDYKPNHD